jgi:hypothetical protein
MPQRRISDHALRAVGNRVGKVHVFISYTGSDREIAKALREELIDVDRKRVECFLDYETIESGKDWRKVLDETLDKADWLVCIYTGEQSEFCGYEIGVFSKARLRTQKGQDARLVCLHDRSELPGVFSHQNKLITFPEPPPGGEPFDESAFYANSPIAKFFADFFTYKELYVAHAPSESERQLQTICQKAKRVTEAFKASRASDIYADTPTQLGIEVRVAAGAGDKLLQISELAEVSGTYESFKLFSMMPPMVQKQLPKTTWGRVREASNDVIVPWMDRLEMDMLAAANGAVPISPEATFRSGAKIYRAILVRHIVYWDRSHLFGVVFVETLPRRFPGTETTSLILAAIVLASRFRFHYVEERAVVEARLREELPDRTFEINMRQFCHDLYRVEQDAAELGLRDKAAVINAFGDQRKEIASSFFANWENAKARLLQKLPAANQPLQVDQKKPISLAIKDFLHEIEVQNSEFLTTALDAYRDELREV